MKEIPACPKCKMENTYPDGEQFVCPDCAFEWPVADATAGDEDAGNGTVKDAHGNPLGDDEIEGPGAAADDAEPHHVRGAAGAEPVDDNCVFCQIDARDLGRLARA